jgi:hypothetical protein
VYSEEDNLCSSVCCKSTGIFYATKCLIERYKTNLNLFVMSQESLFLSLSLSLSLNYTFHVATCPKIHTDYWLEEMLTSKKMPKNWLVNIAGNVQLVDRNSDAVGKGREIHRGFWQENWKEILGRPRSRWKGNMKMDIE